ncbi:hypothetical protein D6783_03130 [Candidatus Woesearchaeota archaeon]|nr:MAG: hypothetical protein D6783_03130 [Candidatus Woesearchaeota archaeon]
MPLIALKRTFEQRRANLITMLNNGKETLDLGKQHQLYGAIKEIENFLKTIDYYRNLEMKSRVNFELEKDPERTLKSRMGNFVQRFSRR